MNNSTICDPSPEVRDGCAEVRDWDADPRGETFKLITLAEYAGQFGYPIEVAPGHVYVQPMDITLPWESHAAEIARREEAAKPAGYESHEWVYRPDDGTVQREVTLSTGKQVRLTIVQRYDWCGICGRHGDHDELHDWVWRYRHVAVSCLTAPNAELRRLVYGGSLSDGTTFDVGGVYRQLCPEAARLADMKAELSFEDFDALTQHLCRVAWKEDQEKRAYIAGQLRKIRGYERQGHAQDMRKQAKWVTEGEA